MIWLRVIFRLIALPFRAVARGFRWWVGLYDNLSEEEKEEMKRESRIW